MGIKPNRKFYHIALLLLTMLFCILLAGCGGQSADQTPDYYPPSEDDSADLNPQPEDSVIGITERTYTLADFEGWWYKYPDGVDIYLGDVFYIDAQAGIYVMTDKYGNKSEEGEAAYVSEGDKMYIEQRYATDGAYMYFGEDGNTNDLYIDYDDASGPVCYRGNAPEAPELPLDSVIGRWHLEGTPQGDESHILEFSEDGSYRFLDSEGNEDESGGFELKLAGESSNSEDDYLFLELEDKSISLSNDGLLIIIPYYFEDRYTAKGYPMYAGSYLYVHEANTGSTEAYDAIQRFRLSHFSWINEGEDSLRLYSDGQAQYYVRNESGWFPTKDGSWEYANGVLTITWSGEYVDGNLHGLDSAEVEECDDDNVNDGFTLPSLGRFFVEVY